MSVTLNPTFSATGIGILRDSLEYPVQDGETVEGINNTIRFARFSWHRDITVEFRSKAALGAFMFALGRNDGLIINYDGIDYYVDSYSCTSTWGGFGSMDNNAVWEYDFSLKRPGTIPPMVNGGHSLETD
jgi:hypothetical protein